MTEFEHPSIRKSRRHLFQGEFVVTDDPEVCVATILGSCVAACIRDPVLKIGGINHFLLPGVLEERSRDSLVAGVHLMELLINGLLSRGAQRQRLEAKLFGGARTVQGLSDIGGQNVEFASSFLQREGIVVGRGSTGGTQGRRIEFWPATGRIRQNLTPESDVLQAPVRPASVFINPNAGDVELF